MWCVGVPMLRDGTLVRWYVVFMPPKLQRNAIGVKREFENVLRIQEPYKTKRSRIFETAFILDTFQQNFCSQLRQLLQQNTRWKTHPFLFL